MFILYLLAIYSSLVAGLNVQKLSCYSKNVFSTTLSKRIYSTQPTTTVDDFAIPVKPAPPTPTITMDGNDDVIIDMDALAAESEFNAFKPKGDISDMFVKDQVRKAPRQAEWFPFLLSPPSLDGSLAGDVGFDPLGFAKDKVTLNKMRDAELKHSRLAMLAAVGWPMSELWHSKWSTLFSIPFIFA